MRSSNAHPLPRAAEEAGAAAERALAAMLVVMTPVGLAILLLPDLTARWLWTTTLYFALQAALTAAVTVRLAGAGRTVALFAAVFLPALALEAVGASSGWPFGDYAYSAALGPLLFGVVPPAIGLAWYIVTVNAWLVLRGLAPGGARPVAVILAAALFVTGVDVMLEPFASLVHGFWVWEGGRVPLRNYVAWFAAAAVLLSITHAVLDAPLRAARVSPRAGASRPAPPGLPRLPALTLGATLLTSAVVNLAHGHAAATAAGAALAALPVIVMRAGIPFLVRRGGAHAR